MEKEDLDFLNSKNSIKFSDTKIRICVETIGSKDEAVEKINNFVPCDGWISFQSTSAKRVQSTNYDVKGEHIIAGEFCNSDGISMSVRFDGDSWKFFTCIETGDGEPMLRKKVRLLSKISGNTYVNYNVYYKFDPELGYRPYYSAFIDFTEEKDD